MILLDFLTQYSGKMHFNNNSLTVKHLVLVLMVFCNDLVVCTGDSKSARLNEISTNKCQNFYDLNTNNNSISI